MISLKSEMLQKNIEKNRKRRNEIYMSKECVRLIDGLDVFLQSGMLIILLNKGSLSTTDKKAMNTMDMLPRTEYAIKMLVLP